MTTGRLPSVEGGIQPTIVDAKGDLIVATAADTVSRIAVGANDTVLTADSSTATGLKWAAAAGGGKVLQVVTGTYSTATTVASTTYTDTGLSLSITPTASTSKILVLITQPLYCSSTGKYVMMSLRLLRGATSIYAPDQGNGIAYGSEFDGISPTYTAIYQMGNMAYLDSPATTSATTYKTQQRLFSTALSAQSFTQPSSSTSSITLLEIGA